MAGIENTRIHKEHDPLDSFVGAISAPDEINHKTHQLDKPEMTRRFAMLWDYFKQELARQSENRAQQQTDADYYDHIQWSREDADELERRGQIPRVYNKIKPAIDWILGTEKRTRIDWKILARRQEGEKAASAKTDVMKYISDANRVAYVRSRAFADSVKVGVGWLEEGVFDNDDGEPLYVGWESWRNMLWDSVQTGHDVNEGRYVMRIKWVDVDVASSWFPDRKELVELSAVDGHNYADGTDDTDDAMDSVEASGHEYSVNTEGGSQHKRQRVRLVEVWYKVPVRTKVIRSDEDHALKGVEYNAGDERHVKAVQSGLVSLVERPRMQTRLAIMTKHGLLFEAKSPYQHNKFPFTAVWGYRRDRDNLPYGVIRGIRDPQDDLNKRISKALAILSTNKTIMDEGAVEDLDEFIREVSRPDAVIIKKPGKHLEINADRDLAPAHLELAQLDMRLIQDASGVTDENMGHGSNATSGKAILARQDQGAMATAELYDNLRLATQISGEKTLSLAEQYYSQQKIIRLIGNKGNIEFKAINDPNLPESNIGLTKADFIVSEQDFRDTLRIAAQEQLAQMVSALPPEMALPLLDIVVDAMELPIEHKEELVARIRKVNGQVDPNQELTPEDQQAMQQAQQQQQAQQELLQRGAMAELGLVEAQVAKTQAEAQKIAVETELAAAQADPAMQQAKMQHEAQQAQQKHAMQVEQANRKALIDSHTAIERARMDSQTKLRQAEIATLAKATMAEQAEQQAMQQSQEPMPPTGATTY